MPRKENDKVNSTRCGRRQRKRTDNGSSTLTRDQEDSYTDDAGEDLHHRWKWLMSSWKNGQSNIRGDTEDRRVFYIIREAAPRSPMSTEPGGKISYFFNSSRCNLGCYRLGLARSGYVWIWKVQSGWIANSGRRRSPKEIRNVNSGDPGELLHRQTEEGDDINCTAGRL